MFFIIIILAIIIVALLILSTSSTSGQTIPAWHSNIEKDTIENTKWRDVVQTSKGLQISLMSVLPGESLGEEVHSRSDQFFRFESGSGLVKIADTIIPVTDGSAVVVPMGTTHDVQNTSTSEPLKFYTIYAPPHHPPGTMDLTHADEILRESS